MVRQLMYDPVFLSKKSEVATKEDMQIARDLADTLLAHRGSCSAMAANMIGESKRIIALLNDREKVPTCTLMFNPEIIKSDGVYYAEEGCLSIPHSPGERMRYMKIMVRYQSADMKTHTRVFTGWTAEIIQHAIDHCNGLLV